MLTQLGLEPDIPGGAVEVRQQDTPELFATLVAVGYKPKAYADGGAVVVPPTRKAPSATAQRSVPAFFSRLLFFLLSVEKEYF